MKQAKGAVFNVVGGPDLSIGDVSAAADVINAAMAPDAMIIFGALVDPRLAPGSDVTVTMVATGFEQVKMVLLRLCSLKGHGKRKGNKRISKGIIARRIISDVDMRKFEIFSLSPSCF